MHDGHLNYCKECVKVRTKQNYRKNKLYYHNYDRIRESRPERKVDKMRTQKAYRQEHPDRYSARGAVAHALRNGTLSKGPCQDCGTTENVEAHHKDYSKPLEVEWYCRPCHRKVEGRLVE